MTQSVGVNNHCFPFFLIHPFFSNVSNYSLLETPIILERALVDLYLGFE